MKEMTGPELLALLRSRKGSLRASREEGRREFSRLYHEFDSGQPLRLEPVQAGGVPGLWIAAPEARQDRAVLFFHGGGFMNGSADDHGELCGHLSRLTRARVLSLNYRLAPENPFPAAVEDGHAAYAWLIRQGLGPDNVALAGISAGGTLALATMLKAKQTGLPLPAAGLLMSPAPNMRFPGASIKANAATDWLTPDRLGAIQKLYLAGHDPDDPLASPVRGDLRGLPPLLVQAGEAELLVDDVLALATALRQAKARARLSVWPGMFHSWQIYSLVLAPGREALREAGKFLAGHLA